MLLEKKNEVKYKLFHFIFSLISEICFKIWYEKERKNL